jgi:hypothetical protein
MSTNYELSPKECGFLERSALRLSEQTRIKMEPAQLKPSADKNKAESKGRARSEELRKLMELFSDK